MAIQLPYTGGTTDETLPTPYTNGGGSIDLTLKEDKANKGVANGYAPLDANSKVPTANLPDQAALDAEVDGKITTHNSATTSVHGIANTANLIRSGTLNVDKSVRLQDTEFNILTELNGASISVDGGASYASVGPTEVIVENISNGKAVGINTDKIKLYTYSAGVGANIFLQGTASGTDKTITLPNATGTIALTNDSRFTDSRTPTSHTHAIADVTNLQTNLDSYVRLTSSEVSFITNSVASADISLFSLKPNKTFICSSMTLYFQTGNSVTNSLDTNNPAIRLYDTTSTGTPLMSSWQPSTNSLATASVGSAYRANASGEKVTAIATGTTGKTIVAKCTIPAVTAGQTQCRYASFTGRVVVEGYYL